MKIPYQEIKSLVNSYDIELLTPESEYTGVLQKVMLKCSCGTIYENTIFCFKQRKHKCCPACANKGAYTPLRYKEVKEYIENTGCKLISTEYKDQYDELEIECMCGVLFKQGFKAFKRRGNYGCPTCVKSLEIERRRDTAVANNMWTAREDMDDLQLYRLTVLRLTEITYKEHKDIINPNNLPRKRGQYSLDHKFSMYEGFKRKVPPFILAKLKNLQILSEYDNIKKRNRCDITIDELLK